MTRADKILLLVMAVIVGAFLVHGMFFKRPPSIPCDDLHCEVTMTEEDCLGCHGQYKVNQLKLAHTIEELCFKCHSTERPD
ncbi:MAG: hypothetical protein HZA22_12140 [Nitrospirae bacterium]|nr:hypothetical protein [Nitrospirota bacterium]